MYMPRRSGTPPTLTGRVLAVLGAFDPMARLRLSEISAMAGLPLSTTFRIVHELLDGRMLVRDADRRYRLGPRVQELAGSVACSMLCSARQE